MRDTRRSQFANSLLNHVPVPYAVNAFYGLEAFRESIAHRGASDNGVDIVVIGSSLSAGAGAGASMTTNWPHLLKMQLQEMLNTDGVGGYGFYPAVMDSNFDGTFAVSLGGAVETGAAIDADLRGCNDSALLIDARDGSDIRTRWFFDPAGRRNNRLWATTLELVFGAFDGGAALTYDLNHSLPSDAYITPGAGGVTGTIDCDGSVTEAFGQRESISVPTRGPVLLQVAADNSQGPGLVEGFILYDGDEAEGVRVHNLSRYLRNFASTSIMTTLNRAAALDAFCGASGAGTFCKLVVIEGGAAEAVAGSSVALMKAKMEALIVRAQNAALCPSKPSILLMIPPCPSGVTPDAYTDYVEAIRSLGETYNCAVLDLFLAFHESGYGTWITSAGFNHGSLVTGFSAEFQRFVADVVGSVLLHGVAVKPAPLIRIGRGVAPAASTVGVVEAEPETNEFVFTLTNAIVPLTDEAGVVAYGGLKFADLPAGAWHVHAAFVNLAITKSSAGVNADWDGDFAIGTVTASNNATLSGTEANVVPSTATPQAAAGATTAKGLSTAGLMLDGTGTPVDLFLNMLVDDADHDVGGTACNLIANGTIKLVATYLGDY